jgi:hypothetical protein
MHAIMSCNIAWGLIRIPFTVSDGMCIALMRTTGQAHMEEETAAAVVVMGTWRALGAHTKASSPQLLMTRSVVSRSVS